MPRSLAKKPGLRLDQLRRQDAMHSSEQCVAAHQLEVPTQLFDAAEAAATLALRDGKPEALGFYRLDPSTPDFPTADPADLLALAGPTALSEALAAARPLAEQLIDERLKTCHPLTLCWKQPGWLPPGHPPTGTSAAISSRLGIPTVQVYRALRTLASEWNIDPRQAAEQPLQALGEVKRRISKAIEDPGEPRRTAPARRLDQPHQPDPASGQHVRDQTGGKAPSRSEDRAVR